MLREYGADQEEAKEQIHTLPVAKMKEDLGLGLGLGAYEKPKDGWVCFHCGERFTTIGGARDHFGATQEATPGCLIRVQYGDERGLQMELRKAEQELARYRAEDSDKDRQHYSMQVDHARALIDAEQRGYDKGLKDGREEARDE